MFLFHGMYLAVSSSPVADYLCILTARSQFWGDTLSLLVHIGTTIVLSLIMNTGWSAMRCWSAGRLTMLLLSQEVDVLLPLVGTPHP